MSHYFVGHDGRYFVYRTETGRDRYPVGPHFDKPRDAIRCARTLEAVGYVSPLRSSQGSQPVVPLAPDALSPNLSGADIEFVTVPLDEMRCESCGRRNDDMDDRDCDACERRWAQWQRAEW